ncbi:MAG: sce7726 family protein [Solobacterium sp.]|nr:sce7726 family protein [Solobacterium sp.]
MRLYDKDIREPLFDYLEEQYGTIRILEEKTAGKSRADVVMVSSKGLFGIEIKSDADTYARLSRQVKDYDRCFDYNYLVAGTRHAYHVTEHVPDWWGIITVEREGDAIDFYTMRQPQPNPKVKLEAKVAMLWRPELALIQRNHSLPAYKEKSKKFVQKKLLEKLTEEQLQQELIAILFERDYTMIEEEIRAWQKENR